MDQIGQMKTRQSCCCQTPNSGRYIIRVEYLTFDSFGYFPPTSGVGNAQRKDRLTCILAGQILNKIEQYLPDICSCLTTQHKHSKDIEDHVTSKIQSDKRISCCLRMSRNFCNNNRKRLFILYKSLSFRLSCSNGRPFSSRQHIIKKVFRLEQRALVTFSRLPFQLIFSKVK